MKCPPSLFAPLIKIIIEEIRKSCKKHPLNCGFNPADNAYEPLKLMQAVMAKTNEVCLRYLDNSMLCSLPSPDTGTPYCLTSVCAVKNTRRRMEDRHVVIHDLNTMFNIQEASPSSYYAVFDGHAGHDAAAYSSAHLHQFLAEHKSFVSNPKQALLEAFCKTDVLFIDKCRVEHLSSGTTAVVALLRPKEKLLYVAWAGDSQVLLVSRESALQLVNPHKPCRDDERERIEKRGGCVMKWGTWRVNGQLAVSRAIGDPDYKPFVIAVPDIQEVLLDREDFVVLACDGLWDTVSEDMVARTVYNLITEKPEDTERISQRLVHLAKEQGSTDNITVIVVFLREPSKIAAEAHWANRNLNPATMEEGLNNANNPFGVANGTTTADIITQKTDGLLLNLSDKFKQNGTDLSPPVEFFEKSNGKRTASEFDEDDDYGPETNIDSVDDIISPGVKDVSKSFTDAFPSPNNNPLLEEGVFNPFMEHQEKAALEIEKNIRKRELMDEFDNDEMGREETPTPPADAVHDVSGLEENQADSESEDEWNYIKGEEANKENLSPQPEKEVVGIPEEDNMSNLNPNAAEFVPVSPTRSIPSPALRMLINDPIVSQSPKKPEDVDINLPSPKEFEKEVKSRPSEFNTDERNEDEDNDTPKELMENVLNGKNIDEIPEFQPGSTPKKFPIDEFHFGPNAAPFTPVKLDQSEAFSTKAVFGDETETLLNTTFNESVNKDLNVPNNETDPMSMSFYADKGEDSPFDLNKVQELPENLDDFLNRPENDALNDTISDLPEHDPLGKNFNAKILNNDEAVQITDLDKQTYDDEKELASPLEAEKNLDKQTYDDEKELASPLEAEKEILPTDEADFVEQFCCNLPVEPICRLPKENIETLTGQDNSSEVGDMLKSGFLPEDVELLPQADLLPPEPSKLTDLSSDLPPEPKPEFDKVSAECDISSKQENVLPPVPEPSLVCKLPAELYESLREAACDSSEKADLIEIPQSTPEQVPAESPKPEQQYLLCDLSETGSPRPQEPESAGSEDYTRPEFLQQAQDRFEDLCKPLDSPQEDVTSSVKDDLSEVHELNDGFVAKSPLQNYVETVEDSFVQEDVVTVHAAREAEEPPVSEVAPVQEQPLEANSPYISRNDEPLLPLILPPPRMCVYPLKTIEIEEPIDVKTENISPEFAEPTIVVTPSDDSRTEELNAVDEKPAKFKTYFHEDSSSNKPKEESALSAPVKKPGMYKGFKMFFDEDTVQSDSNKSKAIPIAGGYKTDALPQIFGKLRSETPISDLAKSHLNFNPFPDPVICNPVKTTTDTIPKTVVEKLDSIKPKSATPLSFPVKENKMQELIAMTIAELSEDYRQILANDSSEKTNYQELPVAVQELKTSEKDKLRDIEPIGTPPELYDDQESYKPYLISEVDSFETNIAKKSLHPSPVDFYTFPTSQEEQVEYNYSDDEMEYGPSKSKFVHEIIGTPPELYDDQESYKPYLLLTKELDSVEADRESSLTKQVAAKREKFVVTKSNIQFEPGENSGKDQSINNRSEINPELICIPIPDNEVRSPISTLGSLYQELKNTYSDLSETNNPLQLTQERTNLLQSDSKVSCSEEKNDYSVDMGYVIDEFPFQPVYDYSYLPPDSEGQEDSNEIIPISDYPSMEDKKVEENKTVEDKIIDNDSIKVGNDSMDNDEEKSNLNPEKPSAVVAEASPCKIADLICNFQPTSEKISPISADNAENEKNSLQTSKPLLELNEKGKLQFSKPYIIFATSNVSGSERIYFSAYDNKQENSEEFSKDKSESEFYKVSEALKKVSDKQNMEDTSQDQFSEQNELTEEDYYIPVCDYSFMIPSVEEQTVIEDDDKTTENESPLSNKVDFVSSKKQNLEDIKREFIDPEVKKSADFEPQSPTLLSKESDKNSPLTLPKIATLIRNFEPSTEKSKSNIFSLSDEVTVFPVTGKGDYQPVCDYSYILSFSEDLMENVAPVEIISEYLTKSQNEETVIEEPSGGDKTETDELSFSKKAIMSELILKEPHMVISNTPICVFPLETSEIESEQKPSSLTMNLKQATSNDLFKSKPDSNKTEQLNKDKSKNELSQEEIIYRIAELSKCVNPDVIPMSLLISEDIKLQLSSVEAAEKNFPKPSDDSIAKIESRHSPVFSVISDSFDEIHTLVNSQPNLKSVDSFELNEGLLVIEESQRINDPQSIPLNKSKSSLSEFICTPPELYEKSESLLYIAVENDKAENLGASVGDNDPHLVPDQKAVRLESKTLVVTFKESPLVIEEEAATRTSSLSPANSEQFKGDSSKSPDVLPTEEIKTSAGSSRSDVPKVAPNPEFNQTNLNYSGVGQNLNSSNKALIEYNNSEPQSSIQIDFDEIKEVLTNSSDVQDQASTLSNETQPHITEDKNKLGENLFKESKATALGESHDGIRVYPKTPVEEKQKDSDAPSFDAVSPSLSEKYASLATIPESSPISLSGQEGDDALVHAQKPPKPVVSIEEIPRDESRNSDFLVVEVFECVPENGILNMNFLEGKIFTENAASDSPKPAIENEVVKSPAVPTKKSAASPATKSPPAPKKASPKVGSATKKPIAATPSKPIASPRTGPAKPPTPNVAARKPSPKVPLTKTTPTPKLQPAPKSQIPPRPATKLTNGEAKPSARLPSAREPVASKLTAKPASAPVASKVPSKPTPRPAPTSVSSKPSVPPRTLAFTSTKPAPIKRPSAQPKLPSAEKPAPAAATKLSARAPPKPATTVPPRPRPASALTAAPPKPRAPITKVMARNLPDAEKQIKESANKITASRNIIQRKGSAPASGRTTTTTATTVRKIEAKATSARTTVTKSTTSSTKPLLIKKKPTEVVKTAISKTKTTKIEKPKENGISTVVTEEITVVNSVHSLDQQSLINVNDQETRLININNQEPDIQNLIDNNSQDQDSDLLKDNSPVDNKIMETQQLVHTNAD